MEQLIYVKCNHNFVAENLLRLEKTSESLPGSTNVAEKCMCNCKQVRGKLRKAGMTNLEGIIEKKPRL